MKIGNTIHVGQVDLLPYQRGSSPESGTLQSDVDAILSRYRAGGESVDQAVLARFRDLPLDHLLSEAQVEELYEVAELVAISGISARRYFDDGWGLHYSNRDHYQLFVQRFTDPAGSVAVETRRRDGSNLSAVSGPATDVARPAHVVPLASFTPLDEGLLAALVSSRNEDDWPRCYEAIITFNLANTDRSDMSHAIELVLALGGFQRLLDTGHNENTLVARMSNLLRPSEEVATKDCERVLSSSIEGFKRDGMSVREAWVRDMCRLRNDFAHGRTSPSYPSVWSAEEHLLFASIAFPLALKRSLEGAGKYALTAEDETSIEAFEQLACAELFRSPANDERWPYSRILDEAGWRRVNRAVALRLATE